MDGTDGHSGACDGSCDDGRRAIGLSIHLLGPPRLERGGVPVEPPRGHKAWGLLVYLLRTRVPPSREAAASLLFPEADDPLGTLRWTLSALRRSLGDGAELGGDPIRLELPPGTLVDVDVLGRGAWLEAVALPGLGRELLEGLSFRSSPAFELWLDGERRHVEPGGRHDRRRGSLGCGLDPPGRPGHLHRDRGRRWTGSHELHGTGAARGRAAPGIPWRSRSRCGPRAAGRTRHAARSPGSGRPGR